MMEETLPNASATRKRRSSILKNQRPPRTPFSELEFHVATPTDANKSRRVSFSKKTGVAEFATNEATTTWKNFYEEQNKSLDLSGHDPIKHGPRASVGHLGNRIFEQHFQEVAADIGIGTIEIPTHGSNTSFDVTQQEMMLGIGRIAIPHHGSNTSFYVTEHEMLDCLDDDNNSTAPGKNFDLSSFTKTQHSGNVFKDNLTNPIMNEVTDRIDIDFSAVENIGGNDIEDIDDVGEIKKDLVFSRACSVIRPSFGNESDMSITDTIRSPKKEISTNLFAEVKKPSMNKDWIEDKENIVVNPYVTPAESDNFAVNEEFDKVLVFDGKKIKYANINANLDEIVDASEKKPKKSMLNLPDKSMKLQNISNISLNKSVPQVIQKQQTIVFEDDDIDAELSMTMPICNPVVKNDKTLIFNNQDVMADMSVTQAVPTNLLCSSENTIIKSKFEESLFADMSLNKTNPGSVFKDSKRQTIVFTDDQAEISVTQCVPDAIVKNMCIRDKTILYDKDHNIGDMSVTQALPTKILSAMTNKDISITEEVPVNILEEEASNEVEIEQKQHTITVYQDDESFTRVIPSDLIAEIIKSRRNTIASEKDTSQATAKRQTIVSTNNDENGDMSISQAIPSEMIEVIKNKRKTIIFEDDAGDISLTQAIPAQIVDKNEVLNEKDNSKRRTIVFQDSMCDISMTQTIPANILTSNKNTEVIENKRKTTIFEDNAGNISLTQAIPAQIVDNNEVLNEKDNSKRRTIVFQDSMCDISMTQTIPANILTSNKNTEVIENKRKTTIFEDNAGNISLTQAIPAQIVDNNEVLNEKDNSKRRTIVFQDSMCDISMTQTIPANILRSNKNTEVIENKRKSTFFEDNAGDISQTPVIPAQIVDNNEVLNKKDNSKTRTIVFQDSMRDISMTQTIPAHILTNNINSQILSEVQMLENNKRKTIGCDTYVGEISMAQVIPAQTIPQNEIHSDETIKKQKTIAFEDIMGSNLSMTQAIPVQIISGQLPNNENVVCGHRDETKNKRKTIVFEDSVGDVSITQAVPAQIISQNIHTDENKSKRKTIVFENSMGDISKTQAMPAQILAEQNTTIFDITKADVSITHADPGEILSPSEAELISSETQTKIDTSAVEVKSVQTSTYMPIVINQNVIVYHASPTKNKITDKVNSNFSTESEISQISEEILSKTSREMSAKTSEESNKSSEGSYKSLEDTKDDHLSVYLRRFISGKSDVFVPDNDGSPRLNPAIMSNVLGLSGINLTGSEESSSRVNKNPSSKGDDFHASSDNITEPAATLNNPPVAHGHQAPRLLAKKNEGLFEARKSEEQKIQSISYDALPTSSTKMEIFEDSFSDNKDTNELKLSASRKSVTFIDDTSKVEYVTKKSLLNDLLNMSEDTEEKSIVSTSKRISFGEKLAKMFYHKSPKSEKKIVINDENEKNTTDIQKNPEVRKSELKLDSEPEENEADENSDGGLQKKLVELQISRRLSMNNTHFDREEPDDENMNVDTFNFTRNNTTNGNKASNNADDTNDILDMISEFTDKTFKDDAEVTKLNHIKLNNEKSVNQSGLAKNVDKIRNDEVAIRNEVENKIQEPTKRYSVTPSLDKSDSSYCGENSAKSTGMKKSIRISNEVIKTLHFDEDDEEETATQTMKELVENSSNNTYNEVVPNDIDNISKIVSPLKKSFVGFDESSSNKSKVIPTYEIDESLKALMSDLVKPTADGLPIMSRLNHGVREKPSTCSTQIQANLISSSQIDIETELVSNADSMYDLDQLNCRSSVFDNNHTSTRREEELITVPQDVSLKSDQKGIENEYNINSALPQQVVVFDHSNPLNNVLLAPIDFSDAHEYNPKSESIQSSNVSIVKRMEFVNTLNAKLDNLADEMQSGDSLEIKDCVSTFSFPSKASTISTVSRASEVIDAEVNTVLAMKDNKELLEVNSSLTLVDDLKSSVNCAVPLNDESEPEYMDLDEPESTKAKKRNFSPSNSGKYVTSSVEITPKPSIKLQKLSLSPKSQKKSPSQVRFNLEVETLSKPKSPISKMDIESPKSSTKPNKSPSPYRRSLSPKKIISSKKHSPDRKSPSKSRRPNSNVTVQQLVTHYGEDIVNRSIQQLVREISPSNIADTEVFSSTISLNSQEDDIMKPLTKLSERENSDNSEAESNDITSRSPLDSVAVDELVNNINKLPFMGTKDCVWESRTESEWSFLLLHSRLRVILHVSRGHVTKISVDVARHDKKNSIAALTVHVALEVLRYMTSLVPTNACTLLRRCVRVSHVADKWADAMRDAQLRLAITVKDNWVVSFKALNIPLREIWEIQLRIEPSLCEGSSWPWPRAEIISVVSVTGDGPCQLENAKNALNSVKKCWGHVPEGIWAIFKQLKKYKPREDPLLALLS